MPTRWILGLAAGSSARTIDAAIVRVDGHGFDLHAEVLHHLLEPLPRELSELLVRVSATSQADSRHTALADRALGESLAAAGRKTADRASISLQQVLCVGLLGYSAIVDAGGPFATHLELGAPAAVAERTGLTVLAGFRGRDLACGGHGGSLGAIVDAILFGAEMEARLILHLDGQSRLTILPRGADLADVRGWDAGPGCVLLDALLTLLAGSKERVDGAGKLAVQGLVISDLLAKWLHHPYLMRRPPKALGRNVFGEDFARQIVALAAQQQWSPHDLLCTAHHLVVRAIIDGVRKGHDEKLDFDRVILTGPGTRNGFLLRLLQDEFAGATVERADLHGMPIEGMEAISAAVLAARTLDGMPGNLPAVTGAVGPRLLGQLTPGSSASWARCLDWLTGRAVVFADAEES